MELHWGRVRLCIRRRFFTREWLGTAQALQSSGQDPKLAGVQEASGQHHQTSGLIFVWSWVVPAVGLNDPHGFLPTQDTV